MAYDFLEHTADVKFRCEASTLEEVFVFAAEAMNETIRGDIKILEQEEKTFEIEAEDPVSLLYDFLEWFLIELDSEDFLMSRVKEISIENGKLSCIVIGDKAENYKFTNDVKAVTFSEMYVRETEVSRDGESGWECQVVLDV